MVCDSLDHSSAALVLWLWGSTSCKSTYFGSKMFDGLGCYVVHEIELSMKLFFVWQFNLLWKAAMMVPSLVSLIRWTRITFVIQSCHTNKKLWLLESLKNLTQTLSSRQITPHWGDTQIPPCGKNNKLLCEHTTKNIGGHFVQLTVNTDNND